MIKLSPTTYVSFTLNPEMILSGWKVISVLDLVFVYKKKF